MLLQYVDWNTEKNIPIIISACLKMLLQYWYTDWNNKKTFLSAKIGHLQINNLWILIPYEVAYASPLYHTYNMNAFFSFDLFMAYIPEFEQQLRTMK
jgi:hypothetical protein